ncbi:hypothetical protein SK128_023445 [Halocaridina rubra]|uniref:Uncharacterized protein n=1 Tax=Halocaridina rubra TaxID=373956 RepID=A0AAN9A9M6_HALRR
MHLSPLVYDSAVEEGIRPLEQVVQCRSTPHHSYDNLSNRIMSPPLSPALSSSHVSSTSCSEVKTATTKTTVTTSTTTTTTYSATTTSSSPQHLRPDILPRASPNPTINSTTEIPCDRGYNNANHENRERLCNYLPDSQILNKGRKRSFQDEEEADDKREQLERCLRKILDSKWQGKISSIEVLTRAQLRSKVPILCQKRQRVGAHQKDGGHPYPQATAARCIVTRGKIERTTKPEIQRRVEKIRT